VVNIIVGVLVQVLLVERARILDEGAAGGEFLEVAVLDVDVASVLVQLNEGVELVDEVLEANILGIKQMGVTSIVRVGGSVR